MVLAYLQPSVARDRLIAAGIYSVELAPTSEALSWVLSAIETRIDGWLGQRMAPTDYTERLTTNSAGNVLLYHYPVLAVMGIGWYRDVIPGHESVPVQPIDIPSVWRQDRRLSLPLGNTPVQVTYRAGYDPIPAIVGMATWDLLTLTLKTTGTTGNVGFLDEPVRDATSLSLPGGISKSFRLGGGGSSDGGGSGGGTILDRTLSPLERYRRRIVC